MKIFKFIRKNLGEIKRFFIKSKNKNVWSTSKLVKGTMQLYKKQCGYSFDIHNPKTFTEKIQWYKLFYDNKDFVNIVDKYLFKKYISKRLGEGYTIPLIGAYTELNSLEKAWNSLPNTFVLKSNLQSDGKYIKIIKNKVDIKFKDIKKELFEWLNPKNTLINSYCRAYYSCTPRIIAERYETTLDNQLYDYKIFCFNGKPFCFYVAKNNFKDLNYPISFYDLNWNKLDVRYGKHITIDNEKKPKFFDEMVNISKNLSMGFPFVRVDFFETPKKLYVAEMTFYPGGGLTLYYPESFNKQLGDMFVIPQK